MQNTIQKFKQTSIVFEKSGILSENLRISTSANYPTGQCFLLKLRSRFLLTNVYKRMYGIFLFNPHLELFAKIKKKPCFYTLVF